MLHHPSAFNIRTKVAQYLKVGVHKVVSVQVWAKVLFVKLHNGAKKAIARFVRKEAIALNMPEVGGAYLMRTSKGARYVRVEHPTQSYWDLYQGTERVGYLISTGNGFFHGYLDGEMLSDEDLANLIFESYRPATPKLYQPSFSGVTRRSEHE